MTIATTFLAVLFILPAAYALDYTVGDSAGWVQGMDYTTWASGKTFSAGDTLVFNYGGSHSVDMVSEADYDNCGIGNALESHNDGNTIISINKSGSMYFICPVFGHCTGGMKLAITVSARAGNTPSDALPATPTPTPTPIPTSPSTIVPNPIPTTPSTTLTPTLPFTATTPTPAPMANTPTALTPNADPDTPSAITPTPIPDTPSAITPTPTTLSDVTQIPTTPTLTTPSTPAPFLVPNGAFSNLYNMNSIVLGASIVLAPLLAFMG